MAVASHVARRYDVKEDADARAELAHLERLGLTSESVVVDIGAGTGQFTLAGQRRRGAGGVPYLRARGQPGRRRVLALHHLPDSTFTWLLQPMIERSGFTIEHADQSPDGILARYLART